MPSDDRDALHRRVEDLEQQVTSLQETISALQDEIRTLSSAQETASESWGSDWPQTVQARLSDRVAAFSSENWTGRLGVGLLVLGLLFLFKYTVDQGWLAPPVRVTFGAVLGGVLLTSGLRIYPTRTRLGGLMLGASSAVVYATVFAAYQLYGLLPYPLAFACMGTVTVATVGLALYHDNAALSVAGAAGGLATPFLLYGETASTVGLVVYVLLLLAGMSAVYLYRGWRSLLYTLVGGGWLVLFLGGLDTALSAAFGNDVPLRDRIAFQIGLVGTWGLLGGVPVARRILQQMAPERWPVPPFPWSTGWKRWVVERPRYLLVNASPLLALAGTHLLWTDVPDLTWAAVAGGGALLYGGAYWRLARIPLPQYAPAHGIVAAFLLTYALSEVLGGATLLLAWSVEGIALHAVARRLDEPVLRRTGHALVAILVVWMAARLESPLDAETALWNSASLSELGVLLGLGGAARFVTSPGLAHLYTGIVWVGWLGWTWSQFVALPNGHAYVSMLWGGTALVLLVLGWRRGSVAQQRGALATLLLFVGKLFLVDLAQLPALWRILLFLGSGGLLLLVSYALPDAKTPAPE